MPNLQTVELKAFVPSQDFERSKSFYQDLGFTLAEAFCGVWMWAEKNIDRIEEARAAFDGRDK